MVDLVHQSPTGTGQANFRFETSSSEDIGHVVGNADYAQSQLIIGAQSRPRGTAQGIVLRVTQGFSRLPAKEQGNLIVLLSLLDFFDGGGHGDLFFVAVNKIIGVGERLNVSGASMPATDSAS